MISKLFRVATLSLSSIAVLGTLLWTLPAHAATGCSNTILTGRYGFLINGTSNGNPITVVGQIATNGTGNLDGTETVSENGTIAEDVAVLGEYKINSNCTGKMTIRPAGKPKRDFRIAVASGGNEIAMIETDDGTTESGVAQTTGTKRCSTSGVKGAYALQGSGAEIGVGPLAFAGLINFHGNGTLGGSETVSVNGSVSSPQKISGAYKIGKQCYGKAVIQVGNEGPIHLNVVVVNGEKGLFFIEADANSLISGSLLQ